MRLSFKFKMSVSDYRQMMVSQTFGNSLLRRLLFFIVWVVFTMILLGDLLNVFSVTRIIHVCALLVAVAYPAAFITMEVNIWKYKEAYMGGLKEERKITADEDGLTFYNCSIDESGHNPWQDVTKLEELRTVFVIQLNRREAVILPKRGMGDDRKIQQFKELAMKKIPKRFYPLKKSSLSNPGIKCSAAQKG